LEESSQIVGKGNGISSDVRYDVEEDEASTGKELSCSVVEVIDSHKRIPLDFPVENGRSYCHRAA
jgi:hypothetical protein